MHTYTNTGIKGRFMVCRWTELKTRYPERITYANNKVGMAIGSEIRLIRAKLGVFCGASLRHLKFRMENPWIPAILAHLMLFFMKPETVKCWKKWIHFCWLELKEAVMTHTGQWVYVRWTHLWVLRAQNGEFLIWTEEEDFKRDIYLISNDDGSVTEVIRGEPFSRDDVKQYRWDDDENAYLPYEPPNWNDPQVMMDMMIRAMTTLTAGSC